MYSLWLNAAHEHMYLCPLPPNPTDMTVKALSSRYKSTRLKRSGEVTRETPKSGGRSLVFGSRRTRGGQGMTTPRLQAGEPPRMRPRPAQTLDRLEAGSPRCPQSWDSAGPQTGRYSAKVRSVSAHEARACPSPSPARDRKLRPPGKLNRRSFEFGDTRSI